MPGDPARSIALLWRRRDERPARGRRPTLTVDAIVGAAVELADEAGLGALSMRALAGRLGVGTMSLYTHVPGPWDPDHAFEFALQRVLDGIELLVESRPRPAGGSRSKRGGS